MIQLCQKSTISFFRMIEMCGQLHHLTTWQNMKGNKCDSENSENCSCSIIFRGDIYMYNEFFNCVYSYFCATSWIFEFEMRKVFLYHFALCTLPFCPVHGAKWYSWPHILNDWFQALMPLYACISFSLVVHILSCQPSVTVTSCFIYKVIRT